MEEINVSDQTRYVVAHILHDAEANVEGQISDYDPVKLQEAENAGLIILAEYNDGTRERVKAKDVREPELKMNGVTLVQPAYVDSRMVAVADVFDALAVEMSGGVALMSMDAEGTASPPTFAEALAKLKELIANGNSGR